MSSVISAVISKAVDVLLKLHSDESRRREWGRRLFKVYSALGDVELSMERISGTLSIATRLDTPSDLGGSLLFPPPFITRAVLRIGFYILVTTNLFRRDGDEYF